MPKNKYKGSKNNLQYRVTSHDSNRKKYDIFLFKSTYMAAHCANAALSS